MFEKAKESDLIKAIEPFTREMIDRIKDRRETERREPKRGVNVRHDDGAYIPKRVRHRNKRR